MADGMGTYWSTYVQHSEELYASRSMRFREDNADQWLKLLRIEDGMKILEIGCAGGIFTHRIKQFCPNCEVVGIDRDKKHIDFARAKAAEFGLDCTYEVADALSLPFPDNTFDLCYSYTVINFCDSMAFVKEQQRVLKSGGIISVANSKRAISRENWMPNDGDDEKELFDKLWGEADKNELSQIKNYPITFHEYPPLLERAGFDKINVDIYSTVAYCPDNHDTPDDVAIDQINEQRLSDIASVIKARAMAPDALSDTEFAELLAQINRRFDRRIEIYRSGEKIWDFASSDPFSVSGVK